MGTTTSTTTHIFLGEDIIATVEKVGTTTTTHYIHTDHLGSTNVVTGDGGEVLQIIDYYPYGSKRLEESSDVSQREYIGEMFDEETNLSYLNARYLDSAIAKFRSVDPVFMAVGTSQLKEKTGLELQQYLADPQGFNSYGYARNNPLQLVDEDGEWFKEFATGQQSWSSFQGELGQAAQYLSDNNAAWNAAISHPYAAGAIVGVGSGVAAAGASAGLTALSLEYAGGIGTGCAAMCPKANEAVSELQTAVNLASKNLNALQNPTNKAKAVLDGFSKQTFPNTYQSIKYHLAKHAPGMSPLEYTKKSLDFFVQNAGRAQELVDRVGNMSYKISGPNGGWFIKSGKVITHWFTD